LHQRAWLLGSGAHPVKPQAKHNRSFSHINPHKMQCVCDVRPLRQFEFTKDTLISGLNPASVAAVFRQIPGGESMVLLSRHHALVADLGACAETLSGTQASARALIALPDDIFNTDAATITAVSTPSPVVAMTFDDTPHPRHTPRLLDMLRERDILSYWQPRGATS